MNASKPSPVISEQSRAAIEATAEALYGGSLRDFANDRKRLATELRQAADRAAASAVAKLPRPTLSAWLVNRLWRQARPEFDALFEAAAEIRGGQLGAVPQQRAALARLRGLAAEVLRADGHAAAEGTLTRTSTTLQALAAAGSFDPDPPGRLLADRDPPGFESMAGVALGGAAERAAAERATAERAAAQRAAAERARTLEREHALAELTNLERLAEQARQNEQARSKTTEDLRVALQRAETALADARSRAQARAGLVAEARARLDALTREPKPSA